MSETHHDLQMIDETLREHRAVVVAPSGVVVGVGPDLSTALRRAGVRAVGATVYVHGSDPVDPAAPVLDTPDLLIVTRPGK